MKIKIPIYKLFLILVLILILVVTFILTSIKSGQFIILILLSAELILFLHAIDHFFNLNFRKRHYLYIFIVAVTGFLLAPLYSKIFFYDKILHFISPILIGAIVFHMTSKLKVSLRIRLTFTFSVVFSIFLFYEVLEYLADSLFNIGLQGVYTRDPVTLERTSEILKPIDDTMIDIVLVGLGTLSYILSILLFFKKKA